MSSNEVVKQVKDWLNEAAQYIKEHLEDPLDVSFKTSPADVVTNVDKTIERFLIDKIMTYYPDDMILGEESGQIQKGNQGTRTWIIDPIDGTLNFYKQRDYFCIMIAIQSETASFGFIHEVMKDELLYGGPTIGVYLNDKKIIPPSAYVLEESIISVNSKMVLTNQYNLRTVANKALALRMVGCAGIGIKEVLLGKQQAYISHLQPWDVAAGKILADTLGVEVRSIKNDPLDLVKSHSVMIALPGLQEEIKNMIKL